jgi:PAS domain S-box-containing protein
MEDAFKRSESQFCFIADYIPTPVWLANADGWIYWYNRGWYEYTGTTPDQMEGWGWQSVHDPAVLPTVLEKWRASIASGEPFEMVFPLRGADGVSRPFLTRVNTIRDGDGKILRWIGINTNVADQLQAEALLFEKDARLRAAFYQTYSFMVLLSADGTILEANEAALEALPADARDVAGKKFWEPGWWAGLPDEVATLKAAIAKAAGGESVRQECRYMVDGREIRYAERSLNPVKDPNGAIGMVVASGVDVTERKEFREKLKERVKERTRELEQKHEQLLNLSGRLLHNQDEERRRIARDLHDSVGQSLAAINMNIASVLAQEERLTPAAAAAVHQNYGLVQQITKEIRTISHLLHPPLLAELGILSSLREYAEGFSERSKIQVSLDFPDALDPLPENMDLAIFRIVQECLTNVYRHSGSATAFIRMTREPASITVEVRDHGNGMPSEISSPTSAKSPGVGLSGMRERVREFGGTLEIDSGAAGTTVKATLPLATKRVAVTGFALPQPANGRPEKSPATPAPGRACSDGPASGSLSASATKPSH